MDEALVDILRDAEQGEYTTAAEKYADLAKIYKVAALQTVKNALSAFKNIWKGNKDVF